MHAESTRAWLEVDLDALLRNARALADQARVPLLPMVKADAYGLGAVPAARVLEALDPFGYGVAAVAEGEELRRAGISRPILVFTPLLPGDFPRAREARLTPALGSAEQIAAWAESGGGAWHLAIDTGMNRAGARWDRVGELAALLERHPPAGAFTHFHSADANDGSAEEQERRFEESLARLPARPPVVHAENSPALERRGASRWSLARPGVFLYGSGGGDGARVAPQPVAHLRAPIVEVRTVRDGETVSYARTYHAAGERRVATLAMGYADGYRRALSNRGCALVRGRRVPVAGLVTMDMTMLDVTGLDCEVGDVATLLGRDGGEVLALDDVARVAEVSPYELLTGLRLRADRVYRGGGR